MWSQTPQFTLSIQPFGGVDVDMNVHHGVIKALDGDGGRDSTQMLEKFRYALMDQKLQDIGNWNAFLRSRIKPWDEKASVLANRLEELLPIPKMPRI